MTIIDLDQLSNITGGAGFNTGITGGLKVPNNKVPTPKKSGLHPHTVGSTTVFGPKSLDDMYWESKPF
jgi:hypothetical protein